MANQYVMYQGIPIDGDRDTMQPMFEAKWDTCPIKVVAQADYDAVVAERDNLEAGRRSWCDTRHMFEARIAQMEAALLRHGHKDGSCGLCASLEEAPRRAHSKSEYKRLTAMGVECAPPSGREPPHCPSCSCGLTQETGGVKSE